MNTQETIVQLKELKLKGMADTLESLMNLPVHNRPSFDFAIAKMVEAEILERKERKTEMFLKTSKLRYHAMIEDVACGVVHIPADTRSAFPVISVQSPVSIQCCWQS